MTDQRRKAKLRRFLRLLLAVTLGVIWINSMLPREESAAISQGLTAWLRSIGVPIRDDHLLRKLAHFGEFCLLGCELTLLFWLRSGLSFQNLSNAAFCALLTAVTDESIQFFSGRGSMVMDVVLDFSGALTGILLTGLLLRKATKKADPR